MRLVFVNIMQELQRFDSTAYITQPPVPLALLAALTPGGIETALLDEQTDRLRFEGDVFAFSVSTQNAAAVYRHADALRAAGKRVVLGGIHVTVCPDEAERHADAIVTGEAEGVWPEVCSALLAGNPRPRYEGSPTPPERMRPLDYRFFGERRYLTPASLFATRGCNRRCSFCVSSRHMGPYREKPLDVLEREISQLAALHPGAFLQFTDDNLLADRSYAAGLLDLLRRKRSRFIAMVTSDQFCDGALMEELAASGCLGVAIGVESVDDDNCAAMDKHQNLQQPFADAVRRANGRGIQTAALIMLGLPHDTPQRLEGTLQRLRRIPCSLFDIRILRIYPSTALYDRMLEAGDVTEDWWLETDPGATGNHLLPSCLGVHFRHGSFHPLQLQRQALRFAAELNEMRPDGVARILGVGRRRRDPGFAGTTLFVRHRLARQARLLLKSIERSLAAGDPASSGSRSRRPERKVSRGS
jgi:radical SAM superfamily enzyme YgiQ (UPF0313 family)